MFASLVQRSLRVPRSEGPAGDGSVVARQLDAVLLDVGFTASGELLSHVAALDPGAAIDLAARTVTAVRELVGDHVQHNAYFIDFPRNVPDTMEFWVSCLREALIPAGVRYAQMPEEQLRAALASGAVNLLDLPTYGRYQHSFADLLAAHDSLTRSNADRVTVLQLGGTEAEEANRLYLQLASSTTPLTEGDRELLAELAALPGLSQPTQVPIRENRAVLNVARLQAGHALVAVDTVTDVLRVAALASGGDVTLATATKFRSFRRPERRLLLGALQQVVAEDRSKLTDVGRYVEQWKRLGKGLHPHEDARFTKAAEVFHIASGSLLAFPTLTARAEAAIVAGDYARAASVLSVAPGLLLRQLDRLLRDAPARDHAEIGRLATVAMKSASGRVLLSLREHLINRVEPDLARVFVGRSKRAWVTADERSPLSEELVAQLSSAIDSELLDRLPMYERLVADGEALSVALPLSGKATEDGFAVLPRGSRSRIVPQQHDSLRFFCYWKETSRRTDFDLSVLMLDDQFNYVGQVSFTSLSRLGVTHSGDITHSRDGATEFIDVAFNRVPESVKYIIPQVNVYSGEGFEEVSESLFGYMLRNESNAGMPFEPRTVRMRSEMRGSGRVALPLAFERTGVSHWDAVWMHMYLRGYADFNRVETNRLSAGLLAQSVLKRRYLSMEYLVTLIARKAQKVLPLPLDSKLEEPVVYIGQESPEGLPEGSEVFSRDRFSELIPG